MTVQELIDALQEVEDKKKQVVVYLYREHLLQEDIPIARAVEYPSDMALFDD